MRELGKYSVVFSKRGGGNREKKHPFVVMLQAGGKVYGIQLTSDSELPGRKTIRLSRNLQQSFAVDAVYVRDVDSCERTKHGEWHVSEEDRALLDSIFERNRGMPLH